MSHLFNHPPDLLPVLSPVGYRFWPAGISLFARMPVASPRSHRRRWSLRRQYPASARQPIRWSETGRRTDRRNRSTRRQRQTCCTCPANIGPTMVGILWTVSPVSNVRPRTSGTHWLRSLVQNRVPTSPPRLLAPAEVKSHRGLGRSKPSGGVRCLAGLNFSSPDSFFAINCFT